MQPQHPSFAIIGAGFSGSLLAVHLLRQLAGRGRVHLIERQEGFGRGLAYSTGNAEHLLNVRAGRMSAFDDDPDHFLRWLATCPGNEDAHTASFIPRATYGRYIESLLGERLWGETRDHSLFLFPDEAIGLDLEDDGATLRMECGRPVLVDAVVLAVGNFPPEAPRGLQALRESPRYLSDPWDPEALGRIPKSAPVLIVGTGLTMVDLVLSLLDQGHTGPMTAISRHGLLPHAHTESGPPAPWANPSTGPAPLSYFLHLARQKAAAGDWRAVIDGMRPHLQDWWQAMTRTEKRRFLRHLRPWWDIHRHRMAPEVSWRLGRALLDEQLTVVAGQIVEAYEDDRGLEITCRPRGSTARRVLRGSHVVNCSGPSSDFNRIAQPLIRQLLDHGLARPDSLRLGLDVDDDLHLVTEDGTPHPRLFALGPVTKGRFWECTSVPDIRRQAQSLADYLCRQRFPSPAEIDG
jgi:uncharacterized NAD(P)/FAD-binding protein YdhS